MVSFCQGCACCGYIYIQRMVVFVPHGDGFGFLSAGFPNAPLSGVFETEAVAVSPRQPTPSWSYAPRAPPEYADICKLCCINTFLQLIFLLACRTVERLRASELSV